MAITKGINITCGDLAAVGGIRTILIRSWAVDDTIVYSNTASTHSISSIKDSGGVSATWFVYEFKNELPTFSVTGARENGSTSYECSLDFMMPKMTNIKSSVIQSLMDRCMMAIAVGNNGQNYVLGVSEKYRNEATDGSIRSQTFCSMTALEGTSGASYNDDSGFTVTLACKQWELPRLYTGTITQYVTSESSTTN